MGTIAFKSLIALIPAGMLLSGSVALVCKAKTAPFRLQMIGAACSVLVVLAHACEALHILPWMGWGLETSPGHYLDLANAVVALTLFPVGYVWASVRSTRARR